jgi:hypothetical protein
MSPESFYRLTAASFKKNDAAPSKLNSGHASV